MRVAVLVLSLSIFLINESAEARRKSGRRSKGGSCGPNKVSSSMYNLPVEGKVRNFKAAVKMQGSGLGKDGFIHTYQGKRVKRPANCKTTATSASGKCLLTYFSVAADPKHFRMGDIIHVPQLVGTKVKLNGQQVDHPGYFVVHDVGGAIKGPGRFDFFVGTDDPYASKGAFNQKGLGDKKQCKYDFKKIARGSADASRAMEQIMSMQDSQIDSRPGSALASGGTR